jgi:hypothetical protein
MISNITVLKQGVDELNFSQGEMLTKLLVRTSSLQRLIMQDSSKMMGNQPFSHTLASLVSWKLCSSSDWWALIIRVFCETNFAASWTGKAIQLKKNECGGNFETHSTEWRPCWYPETKYCRRIQRDTGSFLGKNPSAQ